MRKRIPALLAATLTGLACGLPSASATSATSACHDVRIPVALAAGGPRDQIVAATWCAPRNGPARADVDVLVPGSTYTRAYWNWPQDPARYSYLARTVAAGRGVLAIDRIGTGASSHPASTAVTLPVDAFVVHQVVGWVRRHPVRRVTLIGHSLGSGVALVEAATYHDVDRLVSTGMLHARGSGLDAAMAAFQPARLTSRFAALDPGYLTTVPGTRAASFYARSADPAVIARDEATKDVVSATEFAGYGSLLAPPASNPARNVTAPVLEVVGQQDALMCGGTLDCTEAAAVRAHEAPYFPVTRSLTAVVVPATGHDLALHPSAPASFAAVDAWITTH